MKIFAGSSNRELAQKIAAQLHTDVSPLEIHVFPDGEKRIRVLENVLDIDCVVVQSTINPTDSHYMELFFIVDALKRSGAQSVTAVIPYLGYQRQDHIFRDGEAVSLAVVVKTLEATGLDNIIAFDLHSAKIPEFFKIPVVHLSALPLFAEIIKKNKWNDTASVLVAPDMGGIRRVKQLSALLDNMPFAAIDKNRDLATGEVTVGRIEGEIKKRALIVDDMISSGGTIVTAADCLKSKGAEQIVVFATHPVFSGQAKEILQTAVLEKIYVTDTIYVPPEKQFEKLEIVSVAKLIGEKLKLTLKTV